MYICKNEKASKKEIITFFLVVIIVSTLYVLISGIPGVGVSLEEANMWRENTAHTLVWFPMTTAIIISLLFRGKEGIYSLLARLKVIRVPIKKYLIAICIMPVVHIVSDVFISSLLGVEIFELGANEMISIWVSKFILIGILMIGEELGWRGYALPIMQAYMTPLKASIILGTLWGVWHYAIWSITVYSATGSIGITIFNTATGTLMTIFLAIIQTWMFNKSGGSVVLAILLHAGNNAAIRISGVTTPTNASGLEQLFSLNGYLIVMGMVAICLVLYNKKMFIYKEE